MKLSKILFLILIMLLGVKSGYTADCSKYQACDIRIRDFIPVGHNMVTMHGMKYCDDLTIMRLDLTTGSFNETLGVLDGGCSVYWVVGADWARDRVFFNIWKGNDIYAVTLKTGKVIGVLKDITELDNIIISPDGAVIYVQTGDYWTKIYNGATYNMITTTAQYRIESSFLGYTGVFTKDSKYLYAMAPNYNGIVKVDTHTGNVLKTMNTIPFEGKDASFNLFDLTVSNDPATIDTVYAVVTKFYRPIRTAPYEVYVYNTYTGGLSVSIPVGGSLRAQFKFSPDNKYLLATLYNSPYYTGEVDVYSIATGKLTAKMVTGTVTQIYPSSSIIAWSNDNTFIYNTGQKLIYFDILQNKIVKELSIIKPWEKPCWKPVDTVHASCGDWEKQAEKLK